MDVQRKFEVSHQTAVLPLRVFGVCTTSSKLSLCKSFAMLLRKSPLFVGDHSCRSLTQRERRERRERMGKEHEDHSEFCEFRILIKHFVKRIMTRQGTPSATVSMTCRTTGPAWGTPGSCWPRVSIYIITVYYTGFCGVFVNCKALFLTKNSSWVDFVKHDMPTIFLLTAISQRQCHQARKQAWILNCIAP